MRKNICSNYSPALDKPVKRNVRSITRYIDNIPGTGSKRRLRTITFFTVTVHLV
ncbi:MAG: hypothetical protein LBU37_00410 [Tannerellaceae bacterium]|nr:hypothetical protein [Tannerellaceae bacterium]